MEAFKKSETRELIEAFASSVITILFIMIFIVQSYMVKGNSMEHTLHDGERLLVDKITFRLRPPQTGDIVVFKYPGDLSKKYIKRVIAVGDQSIQISNKEVIVNGRTLVEPYIAEKTDSDYSYAYVPRGTIFAMGDNRNQSSDSRSPDVGYVPLKNVVGRAVFVYWPLRFVHWLSLPKYPDKYEMGPKTLEDIKEFPNDPELNYKNSN